MGLLDHSTNNIILDAVLTDYGRRQLANNASLGITSFSLGDDEIDYGIIKKYGRAVGKEKIEKNTPIFEAFTNGNIALKSLLFSKPDSSATVAQERLAKLSVSSPSVLSITTSVPKPSSTLTATLQLAGSNNVTSDYLEGKYSIKVPTRFITITKRSGDLQSMNDLDPSDPNQYVTYTYTPSNSSSGATGESIELNVIAQTLDSTTATVYGKLVNSTTGVRQIDVWMRIMGMSHSTRADVKVSIQMVP